MIESRLFFAEEIYSRAWRITNTFNDKSSMNTYAYLIEGDNSALVIDTMFGYGNLREFCQEITDKPLRLVLTHFHGDHAGGTFDFDECYIHPADIPSLLEGRGASHQERFAGMQRAAKPEYADKIAPDDISREHPVWLQPVWDGDAFDLGGKQVEVIHVGGHTPGEIVLLDRAARAVFTGDACNSNTLLQMAGCLSVEEYLAFLHHFKSFQGDFDVCYAGHEQHTPSIVDEGIALCEKVLAGTDDREERVIFGSLKGYYGKAKDRKDGTVFNIGYSLDNIHKKPKAGRVLGH